MYFIIDFLIFNRNLFRETFLKTIYLIVAFFRLINGLSGVSKCGLFFSTGKWKLSIQKSFKHLLIALMYIWRSNAAEDEY
jgi:hypothetical protein